MHVDEAILSRRSIRVFKPDPVPIKVVRDILEVARRSPSGTNVQPWKIYVVSGDARDRLVAAVLDHRETSPPDASSEFPGSAKEMEPYTTRKRTLGKAMYTLLEIPKGDRAANWAQWGRNYKFFDAPVGLIFTIDKELGFNSWLDIGIIMQSVMLAARARGLDTCAQGAWNQFWSITKKHLDIPDTEYICAGMSLGFADETAPVNRLVSEREPLEEFVRFFED